MLRIELVSMLVVGGDLDAIRTDHVLEVLRAPGVAFDYRHVAPPFLQPGAMSIAHRIKSVSQAAII